MTEHGPCECGRGPAIGYLFATPDTVKFRVRMATPGIDDTMAADLRCIDCATDAIAEAASGKAREQMRQAARAMQDA